MASRRIANPKSLLPVAGLALVLFSAIAIFFAVGFTPEARSGPAPAAPVTETSTLPMQPPPPPIMLPAPMPQVPCMGSTDPGCTDNTPKPGN
ncbi:MAG: hypothetical protein ACR2JM_11470 [Mycobacterium sp.]